MLANFIRPFNEKRVKKVPQRSQSQEIQKKVAPPVAMGYLPLSLEKRAQEISNVPKQVKAAEWVRWEPSNLDFGPNSVPSDKTNNK
jgi:hypothetical protein